ncbi:MAG: helix-turn-helix domain-containing protein [Brevefilum sp.]|jgi:excisionase family DNA binding protein|nr:helix-turn-helix domain-containing protein [Brevefilum sp.]
MENIALRDTEQLLKATEIAHILNISRAMAYRLMQLGKIRTVSIGTAKRVRRKDLRTFIENNLSPMSEV